MAALPRIDAGMGARIMCRPSNTTVRNAFGLLLMVTTSASSSATARADEPHALITIGMRRVFDNVMPAYEATSGRKFRIEYGSTIEIAQRVTGGESADFVVASRAGID